MFHIDILLYVINKDEILEFKIPWLVCCLYPNG